MKHIICSSFGKDSNATALLALQHGEPLDEIIYTEVMFSKEISGELPEHTRFIYETAIPYFEKRGIPTRVLHAEKTYLDCFYHVVSRGNAQGKLAAFPLAGRCAIQRDCKVPPLEAYKKSLPPGTVSYLGLAADEPIRLERLKPDQVSLMAKYGVTEQDAFAIFGILQAIANMLQARQYGQQSIQSLNRQSQALASVELNDKTLPYVRRQLKEYSVDFAITKDKDTGQLNLWFKGQDVDRIQTAIENCIAARGKERPTSLLQELSERAIQRTKELNQHRPPPAQERGERL